MTLLTTLSGFALQMQTLLQNNQLALGIAEGQVWYGDQERLPKTPAVCIEPSTKAVELYGAGRMTEVKITLFLLVYHSEIRNVEANRLQADQLAEAIASLVNLDGTFAGSCIHCYVTEVTSGYSTKANTTIRTTRITWEATTQERLPNNP